jgi:hypothetical protein
VNTSRFLALAARHFLEPPSQHDANGDINMVCCQTRTPSLFLIGSSENLNFCDLERIPSERGIFRLDGSFEIRDLAIRTTAFWFILEEKDLNFQATTPTRYVNFFLIFLRGHASLSGLLITERKAYFAGK